MSDHISSKSRKVARNTLLLYLRMLLMMLIGLFTSRVILRSLGVDDFGTYSVISEMVLLTGIVSTSISNAVSRFMTFEIGRDDVQRQKQVFTSSIVIQTIVAAGIILLASTLGLWYMTSFMDIDPARMNAAYWVLACSTLIVVVQLYSIPFNATIIAHEQMRAFALISILEAVLKLAVAYLIATGTGDRLVLYAILMLCVAIIIRATYAMYCRRHFEGTRLTRHDRSVTRSMLGFSAWSFMGNGVMVLNTKGISLLANRFYGVGINAARAIALQVENIVRQFVSNFLTAMNPQIIKSWASDDTKYCYEVVGKGCKFSYLLMLVFALPFAFESNMLLRAWLGEGVPAYASAFTSLTLICLMADMMANSLAQLVLATGRVARYYIVTSMLSLSVFAGSYIAFKSGCEPTISYYIFIGVYMLVSLLRLCYASKLAGLPIRSFLRENVLGNAVVTLIAACGCLAIRYFICQGWIRLVVTLLTSTVLIGVGAYFISFTKGERSFIKEKLQKILCRL